MHNDEGGLWAYLKGVGSLERVHRRIAWLLFAWLFLTVASYYTLRPVRSALVLSDFGPRMLPWVYMGTALLTGLAVWVYNRFTHLPRKYLLGGVLAFFTTNLIAWWWLIRGGHPWVSPAFYVWTDVFSIMSITVFWMYTNDIFPPLNAKLIFGFIGSAGPAGAIAGAGLTQAVVERVGAVHMPLVTAGIFGSTLVLLGALEWVTEGKSASRMKTVDRFESYDFSGARAVFRAILSSRVLFLLAAVVCLERLLPDFVDYIFSTAVYRAYPERESFARFFAQFELWRNVLVLFASLYLTPRILKNLGVPFALLAVPLTVGVGCAAFAMLPGLGLAVLLKGLEEGQRHAWFKAGKEVIYTATSSDVIYKVKSYIEMFMYRAARGVAGFLILIMTALGLGIAGIAAVAVPLAAVWALAAWRLGRTYEAMEVEEGVPVEELIARVPVRERPGFEPAVEPMGTIQARSPAAFGGAEVDA